MNRTSDSTRRGHAAQLALRGGPIRSATRRTEELLVKRGLYPFEFRVTVSAAQDGHDQPYTVRIEASDGDLCVEKSGVPLSWIESCAQGGRRDAGADDFDRFVDTLLTELLAKMG